ncbi:ommochrome-binding protein-like isoform X2 [Plodia interpunctella]|uniref:ommochrome-binding protein-like isoform X2 n=1 Tax=Plodia interpunctella TaxID=58824 RepID=UPI0023678741|nr:ommochrome-binding protein-like isoform X2 [Plodia interpunctella]
MLIGVLITAALISTVSESHNLYTNSCDSVKIRGTWYIKVVIWKDVIRPMNLNVHKSSNTLFFSYSVSDTIVDVDSQIAYIHLNRDEFGAVSGVIGGCAIAIDQYDDIIYLGGSHGIYTYNMYTKLTDPYKGDNINIWSLFYNRNLFCITFPKQKLYVEIDGNFAPVREFERCEVDQFFANNKYMFFANKTGLFSYNVNRSRAEIIQNVISVRQITEDNNENIYVCSNLGTFLLKDGKLIKFINLKSIYGIAFDNDDNIIYSSDREIVKLVRSEKGCLDNT